MARAVPPVRTRLRAGLGAARGCDVRQGGHRGAAWARGRVSGISSIPTLVIIRGKIVLYAQPGALPEQSAGAANHRAREIDMDEVRAGRTRRRRPHPKPSCPRPLPAAGHRARLAARAVPAMAGSHPHRPTAPAGRQKTPAMPTVSSRAKRDTKAATGAADPLPAAASARSGRPGRRGPGPEAVDLFADRSADGYSRPAGLR